MPNIANMFYGALAAIVAWLPLLIGAAVILLIGWGISKLVQAIVSNGLRALRFDRAMDHAGVNDALRRANFHRGASGVLGVIAYWFVFLLFIQAAVGVLGIAALTGLVASIVAFLPRVFLALLVVGLGLWGASALARLTRATASTAGISYGDILGTIVQAGVLVFTFALALDTLGLNYPLLTTAFALVLGTVAIAAALAFGLAGREYASDVLAGRELRSVFNRGDRVTTDNVDGTIEDIKPTLTLVRTNRGDMAVQNSELMNTRVTRMNPPQEGRRAA